MVMNNHLSSRYHSRKLVVTVTKYNHEYGICIKKSNPSTDMKKDNRSGAKI